MISTISEAALFLSSSVALSILVKATIMLALGFIVTRLAGRSRRPCATLSWLPPSERCSSCP